MAIEPYLNFNGHGAEAIAFYEQALGAEVVMCMRFSDSPSADFIPPGAEDKIMHATLNIRGSTVMLSDAQCAGELNFAGVSLSVQVETPEEGAQVFAQLADGGEIEMPFHATFWTSGFGMTRDRFGVSWMVNVTDPNGAGA